MIGAVRFSAGRHDAFSLCVGHLEGEKGEEVFVADVIRGRQAPFDPKTTAVEFAALAREFGCTQITGDNFAGEWVAAAFKDAGARYAKSPHPKSTLYLESLPWFNRGSVRIPDHAILLRELRQLERRTHRSGKDSVDHPRRGSDDLANALAGAMYIAFRETRRPKMRQGAIGVDGSVAWKDNGTRPRLQWATISEADDLRARGLPVHGPARKKLSA